MSQEQFKLEKKIIKHRNRNAGYHFQLPAFVKMVHRANAVPILDSHTVNLLEALTDLLAKIAEFDGYRTPNMDELDFSAMDVSFSFGCHYCSEKDFSVMQALNHVMMENHPRHPDKQAKKLERFRKNASGHYETFLIRKHELMIENRWMEVESLDRMIDFHLVTKSFLKMTSRYLASLDILEVVPSTIVARGVIDLLKQIDSLITRAKCIETVPEFNTMMGHLTNFDVKFVSKGEVFDEVRAAMDHAAYFYGLKPLVERNIFSLPPMANTQLPPNNLVGSPIMVNPPMSPRPNGLPNIAPFTAGPPIRMMPPPQMPITRPPMIPVPLPMPVRVNMHVINVEQQRFQQMLFNPSSMGMPQQTHTMVFQQQQQQQQMSYQTLPPLTTNHIGGGNPDLPTMFNSLPPLNQTGGATDHPLLGADLKRFLEKPQLDSLPNHIGVGCGNGNPDLPTIFNSPPPLLPPLNQAGTTERPLFSADLKRFLEKPQLDSLIENGNYLVKFEKSSVIPGELAFALKAVAPEVKVKCFGAKVSGVGYEEDFINLYVDDGTKPKTAASVKLLFAQLMTFFTANSNEWVVQNTEEAGVRTHLTVKNNCENLCCRISFASEIYCSNSKLIRYYMNTFPMCQKLCYFVQEFVKLIDLDFNRYVIVVLVIFYLQRRDYLPTVAQLQSNLPQEELCGPWLINFAPKSPGELKLKDCETDLRRSATDFFQFYGTQFSFRDSVVCPQIGLAVNQSDFFPENDWRMPLKRYKNYLEACQAGAGAQDAKNMVRFVTTPMCVQDLLELTTNISHTVNGTETEKFVRLCKMAYEFYSNNQ